MSKCFFARAGRAGSNDLGERTPELWPLRNATVSLCGLGCLGAPSALEFARSGVQTLRLLDHDIVDPATIQRWPLGLQVTGLPKAEVLAQVIQRDYPLTAATPFVHRLGGVRSDDPKARSELDIVKELTSETSLIYDATAEVGVQHYLSDVAADLGVPYIGVDASYGGWGGRVVRIVPGCTEGCWLCYRYALCEKTIPDAPSSPDGEIQPVGCADPTFTGASFDLVQVALAAMRVAVSTLCAGNDGAYPRCSWDVTIVAFRDDDGQLIEPQFVGHRLGRHPKCPRCNAS